ncbi:MAG: hypothetical protein ABJE10_01625 [bacterium]
MPQLAPHDDSAPSLDAFPQVLIINEGLQLFAHTLGVDDTTLVAAVCELEEGILGLRRHHGTRASSVDLLNARIDRRGDLCDLGDAILRELDRRSASGNLSCQLLRDSVLRLRENADKLSFGDADDAPDVHHSALHLHV